MNKFTKEDSLAYKLKTGYTLEERQDIITNIKYCIKLIKCGDLPVVKTLMDKLMDTPHRKLLTTFKRSQKSLSMDELVKLNAAFTFVLVTGLTTDELAMVKALADGNFVVC